MPVVDGSFGDKKVPEGLLRDVADEDNEAIARTKANLKLVEGPGSTRDVAPSSPAADILHAQAEELAAASETVAIVAAEAGMVGGVLTWLVAGSVSMTLAEASMDAEKAAEDPRNSRL
jgi:hypothetical protein